MIWGGSKLLPEKWLDALRFSVKIETVFSAQIEVFSKKKKKKKKKKVFTETETVFWQWCAQISTLFAQINRPFARIFYDFRRFEPNGGATAPPAPPPPTAMLDLIRTSSNLLAMPAAQICY